MNKIGETIKILRKENKLTQTELAKLIPTTQDTISLWELGKSYPSVIDVIKLTKIFSVSADFILGLEEY